MRLIDADALLEAIDNNKPWLTLTRAINLITNAPTVQREGWVSVPIEPTELQMRAACKAMGEILSNHKIDTSYIYGWVGTYILADHAYKAMIQAAPTLKEKG